MTARRLRTLAFWAALLLLLLGGLQVFWFSQAFDRETAQWERTVNLALRQTADHLLKLRSDSTSTIPPVIQVNGSTFMVRLQTAIGYIEADSILKQSLHTFELSGPHYFTLMDCVSGKLVIGGIVDESNGIEPSCLDREQDMRLLDSQEDGPCVNLAVSFPNRNATLLSSMPIWIFSSFVFVLVLAFAAFALASIWQGKKLREMQNDFFNNLAHELKTPIANIRIASEVLQQKPDLEAEKASRYANIIATENNKLQERVEQVLALRALEHGTAETDMERVNLHELISQAVENMMLRIEARGGKLVSRLKAEQVWINGNREHLFQAILNLLDNADKYSRDTPDIQVSSQNRGGELVVAVEDHGIGMDRQVREAIFDRFYRAPEGDRHEVTGFGLGLSYVRSVLRLHRAKIKVDSSPGQGSRFELSFPIQ